MRYLGILVFWVFFGSSSAFASEKDIGFSLHEVGSINSTVSPTTPWQKFDPLPFKPTGAPSRANPPTCSAHSLEGLLNRPNSADVQSQLVQDYFNRCGKTISRFGATTLGAVARTIHNIYEVKNRPGFYETVIRVQTGADETTQVRGILALKNSTEKRPLIIAVCGADCNTPDEVPKQLLMALFDATPFNVLVVASTTGNDFALDNKRIDIGGLSEGREVFEIAKLIAQPPSNLSEDLLLLNRVTSSIHILGISLGGHASLYAGLYASANPLPADGPQIQSIFGYCPLVDIGDSIEKLDHQNDAWGKYFQGVMWGFLSGHKSLADFSFDKPLDGDYKSLFGKILTKLYISRTEAPGGYFAAPFEHASILSPDDFWRYGDFKNFYLQNKIPTLVFGAEDDPIVNPELNSLALRTRLQTAPSPYLGVVTTPKGLHCSTEMFYGWDVFVSFLSNYFLSHSPEFDQAQRQNTASIQVAAENIFQLDEGEKFFGHEWQLSEDLSTAILNIKIFNPHQNVSDSFSCESSDAYNAPDLCFRTVSLGIPLKHLMTNVPDLSQDSVVQATTRWLNGRVIPLTAGDQEIVDTQAAPAKLKWMND